MQFPIVCTNITLEFWQYNARMGRMPQHSKTKDKLYCKQAVFTLLVLVVTSRTSSHFRMVPRGLTMQKTCYTPEKFTTMLASERDYLSQVPQGWQLCPFWRTPSFLLIYEGSAKYIHWIKITFPLGHWAAPIVRPHWHSATFDIAFFIILSGESSCSLLTLAPMPCIHQVKLVFLMCSLEYAVCNWLTDKQFLIIAFPGGRTLKKPL